MSYLRESANVLDQQIAAWFEIQRIVDDALSSLGHDNPLLETPVRESQMIPLLKWFDSHMLHWKKSTLIDLHTSKLPF